MMDTEPRKIVVSGCGGCPFCEEDYHCNAKGWRFDDYPEDGAGPFATTPPSWCPLRQGAVTVELEVKS